MPLELRLLETDHIQLIVTAFQAIGWNKPAAL
jgi:hypothetical protein